MSSEPGASTGAIVGRPSPYIKTEKLDQPLGNAKRNIPVQSTEWPEHWINRISIDVLIEQELIMIIRDHIRLGDDSTYMDLIEKINRQVGKAVTHALFDMNGLDSVRTTVTVSIDRDKMP